MGSAVQPFLDAIAREVHWLGEAGQGTRIGLLFNAWIGMLEVEVPLRLAHKNVLLALDAAGDERHRLPVLDRIGSMWSEVIRDHGESEISAVCLR